MYGKMPYNEYQPKEQPMTTINPSAKTARIETRVSKEQKELIERAATFSGRTVSEFVLAHIEVAAKKVIEEHEKLHLDQAQSRILVEALLSPKKPNKKLKTAMDEYRKRVESR
jgi:uncharacterized protein (DUF1778 family)